MGETTTTHVGGLKKGRYIVHEGVACKVADIQTSRPGKHGHAKCRVSAVGITTKQKYIFVKPAHDKIDVPIIEKKTAQVLSVSGDKANVMDVASYETFDLDIPADLKDGVKDNVNVAYWIILDDKVMKEVK
jgi:translation initiation factor 5A